MVGAASRGLLHQKRKYEFLFSADYLCFDQFDFDPFVQFIREKIK